MRRNRNARYQQRNFIENGYRDQSISDDSSGEDTRFPRTQRGGFRNWGRFQRALHNTGATTPKDDDIWDFGQFGGTLPRYSRYGVNADLSTLPTLCKVVYDKLEWDINVRRRMPYCAFQHVMNEFVTAHLIRTARENYGQSFSCHPNTIFSDEDIVMPEPIAVYLQSIISDTLTPSGDTVIFNLPRATTPQLRIPAHGSVPEIGPGSFGAIDANSHNAYEVAMAPIVTSGLVLQTVIANTQDLAPHPVWQPLPAGAYPQNAVPNLNMLGWHEPERLKFSALDAIRHVEFSEEGMAGMLRHSAELVYRVTTVLQMTTGMPMRVGWLEKSSRPNEGKSSRPNNIGYLTTTTASQSFKTPVRELAVQVRSSCALSASQSCRTALLGIRRERTADAPGCSMTVENADPPGWAETRNWNHTMTENFGPINCPDLPQLREWMHDEILSLQSRSATLASWINNKFQSP